MSGPFKDDAGWKQFVTDDAEAAAISELEMAINNHREQIKMLRAVLETYRSKHAWKLRNVNPYKGGKSDEDSGD